MFTGIIEEKGVAQNIRKQAGMLKIFILADKILDNIKVGDSIAVNGACLTLSGIKEKILEFDVMKETLQVTNLLSLKKKDIVNLERALKVGDRVGGHFVTGHVDCLGILRRKITEQKNITLEISFPSQFMRYIIKKGSVSIEGISLTISDQKSGSFRVSVIPHTWEMTNLTHRKVGDKLNIEFDILLKRSDLSFS